MVELSRRMYPMKRLTWDDEVRISDDLHRARVVRERLGDSEPTTEEDRAALAAGRAAADELVVAHSGLVSRIATEVLRGLGPSGAIDFEDLVQVGLLATYAVANSFDARLRSDGIAKDSGNRFSVYARMYIKRDMVRAIKRGHAAVSGSAASADRTREWMRMREALEDRMGRKPSNQEVSEACGIRMDEIDPSLLAQIPALDDPGITARTRETTGQVDDDLANEEYAVALDAVLRTVLTPDEADAFSLWVGLDRDIPRSMVEVAREMNMRVAHTGEVVASALARLRHPQNVHRVRDLAASALDKVDGARRARPGRIGAPSTNESDAA